MAVIAETPSLVVHPHALVGDGRISVVDAFLPRETLGEYIKRTGVIVPAGPVIVWHNGYRVPDKLWRRLIPRTGDQVIIRARVMGGGGSSKILRTVAMIALIVAANAYGAALGAALGITTASTALAVGSSLIMIGGSLLINALLPPPKATAAQLGTDSKYESSPTYAISGGRNRARPWEPMPLIFGRHKVVPDLGATPYTQYVGDNQYLSQVFHFGLQAWAVVADDFRIGDTPISSYQDVWIESSGLDGKLSMFPGNVDSISGFVLDSGVVNSRTTAQDVVHLEVELASSLFFVNDDGSIASRSVDLRIQYRPVGGSWTEIGMLTDAIYADHYWALVPLGGGFGQQYAYDSIAGLHTDGDTQVWGGTTAVWRWTVHPHALGKPWQGIAPDPLIGYSSSPGVRLTGARQEPTRQTIGWNVAKGQYEVRVWKVTADIKNSRESNETAVNQILVFQTDNADYTGQLRVALRIKATAQLSGAVDEFSAIARAWCTVWDGTSWVWAHTSNPAWWYLWFARGKLDPISGNRLYGATLPDTQIDIEAIKAWGAWCDQKGLTFNYVLDRKMASADVLGMIARAGRASPTWQTGKLGVVWDAADLPHTGMFGPFNIKAGSFAIDYINDGSADEIVLNFTNPDRGWQMDEVRVKVPGATSTNNPLQLDFDGCTDPVMAGREANLLAASQVWHRRRIAWETDVEGWVVGRGDVVQMSHDLTVWGYSGRLYGRQGNTLTLDKSIPSDGAGTMMLRDPEGNMKTVAVTSSVGEVDELTITTDVEDFPLPGDEGFDESPAMDWAWFFDPMATPGRRFKITEVVPSEDGVKFTAIDDDPGYYASENNPYLYTPPRDGALLSGTVFAIAATESVNDMAARLFDVRISWTLSAAMPVDVSYAVNGLAKLGLRTSESAFTVEAKKGDVITATVTPVSTTVRGTPKTLSYTVLGEIAAPAGPAGMSVQVEGAQLRLTWVRSPSPDIIGYEVRDLDAGWGDTNFQYRGDTLTCLVDAGEVGVAREWYVRAVNAANLYATSSAVATYTVASPADTSSISELFADTSLTNATVTLDWPDVDPIFGLSAYRVSYDAVSKTAKSNTITLPADWIGARTFKVQTIDSLGNLSTGFEKSVTKLAPDPVLNFRAQVIDNNVLLYWGLPPKTTLPVARIRIKKGEDWATAQDIGTKDGTFTSLQELQAGNYTYWAAVVDTDNYESAPVGITARVAQPPDFQFNASYESDFSAIKSNALAGAGFLLLPVDTDETWAQHFTGNGWTAPQDQIDAGFPIYIQPGVATGYYEEVFDYGTVLGSSQVTVSIGSAILAGSPTMNMSVSVSADGVSYIEYPGAASVFAYNFQYIKVRISVTQSEPGDLMQINGLTVRLDAKQKTDGGQVDALATDADGTVANFVNEFVDVGSITLTPQGTAARTAVYDFKDTVISGTYALASNVATVNAAEHDLVVGQRVRLSFATGSAPSGVYTVASVISADAYTVSVESGDTSGAVSTYSQGLRIYLFDNSGARVSGAVSWAVRGY